MAIGATASPQLAFRAGEATARELRAVNMNVVLAPVMDVNNNPDNPVIGTRAFGETPQVVSDMGVAWLRGAQSVGVAACAKHFPGHGDTHVDSHLALPRIDHARDALERTELRPFREAIRARVALIMPGHLLMSALDAERPASLSGAIVEGVLRSEMHFDGVVITDALDMHAVALDYGIPGAAVAAAAAGCDLLCVITQHEETLKALERAVGDGRLTMSRVQQSVERVKRLRAWLAKGPSEAKWLGAPEHRALANEIAHAAIRVTDPQQLTPIRDVDNTFVVEFALGRATIAEGPSRDTGRLLARLQQAATGISGVALPFNPDAQVTWDITQRAGAAHTLVVATRQAAQFTSQRQLVRQLLMLGKPSILVALRDPYDLAQFPEATCTVAAFDDTPAMLDEIAFRLFGALR
jgi:beta-N-acetylhexosaminidase